MNAFKSGTIAVFLAGITILSCKSDVIEGSIMVDDTKYETVNLEDMTSELEFIRIKTDESLLIGGCESMKVYDDYIFISDNGGRLYCIEGDSVISVLNKQGRGHGEYNFLNWWCYSTERKTLYVANDESLLCYSVPDFTFTGKIEEDIYPIETFGDIMFYEGPDEENNDSTIEKSSLYRYSLASGQKTKIMDLSRINSQFIDFRSIISSGDDILISLCGRNNRILRYSDSIPSELALIRYDSKFATPKKIDEFVLPSYEYGDYSGKINEIIEFYDYFSWYDGNTKTHAYGCFLPQFGKNALTFWHSHNEPGMSALFYTVCNGTETSNYLLTIPGLLKEIRDFTPITMNSGYVYAIYQGNRYMLENPDEEPSPLASRILTLVGKSFNDEYLIILRAKMRY